MSSVNIKEFVKELKRTTITQLREIRQHDAAELLQDAEVYEFSWHNRGYKLKVLKDGQWVYHGKKIALNIEGTEPPV